MSLADIQSMKALKIANKNMPYNLNGQVVNGQEYLSAYQKKVIAGTATKVVFTGDSTTAGDGTTAPYRLSDIFSTLCSTYISPNVTTYNQGHSGAWTTSWASSYVNDDLALNPDLIVVRWGLNDANLALDTSSFQTALRSGLTTLRNSRALSSLSIILMSPNNVDSATYPEKNPKWGKAINEIIRQAARDFQCCFIDTFTIWNDATNGSDWMDSYNVHPQNVANTWITSKIFDTVFPTSLRKNSPQIFNEINSIGLLDILTQPQLYPKGITIYKTKTTGWNYANGNAFTIISNSGGVIQFNYSADVTIPGYFWRIGSTVSNTWSGWQTSVGFVSVPVSSTATGQQGQISANANYLYVCYATNTWIRVPKDSTIW